MFDAREANLRSFNSVVMEPIGRGIAGLFAPASNTFGVLLFIFHALLIATASALPQVQRPSPSSTACARVGRMTAARLAANPSGQFENAKKYFAGRNRKTNLLEE